MPLGRISSPRNLNIPMATTTAAFTPSPLPAEANPSTVRPASQAQQKLTPITGNSSNTPVPCEELETLAPAMPSSPFFTNSISKLKELSAAITAFHQCYEDLQNHFDSINVAILSKMPQESPEIDPSIESSSEKPAPSSELDGLCKMMSSRGIRKYLAANLSNLSKLREQVPKALKLARNPLKLVLECLGKFFLQGSKAYTKDSPMIPAREASILMLECFLLMMGMIDDDRRDRVVMGVEKSVREEAETAAVAWKKRLVAEGGVAMANQIDARGLLLFVACYGIPALFTREDIRDLVIAGNAKEIASLLQNSLVLMKRIPEIVEDMVKNKMEVDAVDIVYTFGLEDQFNPQTILTSFLRESKEIRKRPKKGPPGFAPTNNDANRKQLSALKSLNECLERHEIDPAKLLPGCQINEKIATLEKETAQFDRKPGMKTEFKRKASEAETSKKRKNQDLKRSRYTSHGQHQLKITGHFDNRGNFLPSRPPNHPTIYSAAPSVVYGGPGAGLMPQAGAGISASHGGVLPTGSFPGVQIGVGVDTAGQVINRGTNPYVWHRNFAANESYATGQQSSVGITSLYRVSTPVEGIAGVANPAPVGVGNQDSAPDIYQFANSVAEAESYYPSNLPHTIGGAVPLAPDHHSSNFYRA